MDLISPSSSLIFWQLLIFLVVLFILGKFAWKPMLGALREREISIEEALAAAENAKKEMAQLKSDNEKLLIEARKERDNILKEASKAANNMREEAKTQASKEASRIIADAKVAIDTEKKAALSEIKQQVAELSVQIAERILRKKLSNDQAQKEYVAKLVSDLNVN